MNTSEHSRTAVNQGELRLIALMVPPCDASEKTVRLCDSEQEAIAVAIALSKLSQAELARRIGISRSYLTMLKTGERTLSSKLLTAFCHASGSNVVRQYRALHSAIRAAQGRGRISDRIEAIAAHSRAAA